MLLLQVIQMARNIIKACRGEKSGETQPVSSKGVMEKVIDILAGRTSKAQTNKNPGGRAKERVKGPPSTTGHNASACMQASWWHRFRHARTPLLSPCSNIVVLIPNPDQDEDPARREWPATAFLLLDRFIDLKKKMIFFLSKERGKKSVFCQKSVFIFCISEAAYTLFLTKLFYFFSVIRRPFPFLYFKFSVLSSQFWFFPHSKSKYRVIKILFLIQF